MASARQKRLTICTTCGFWAGCGAFLIGCQFMNPIRSRAEEIIRYELNLCLRGSPEQRKAVQAIFTIVAGVVYRFMI